MPPRGPGVGFFVGDAINAVLGDWLAFVEAVSLGLASMMLLAFGVWAAFKLARKLMRRAGRAVVLLACLAVTPALRGQEKVHVEYDTSETSQAQRDALEALNGVVSGTLDVTVSQLRDSIDRTSRRVEWCLFVMVFVWGWNHLYPQIVSQRSQLMGGKE
jgi:hypothetical protein